jgi:hypothetical protein
VEDARLDVAMLTEDGVVIVAAAVDMTGRD